MRNLKLFANIQGLPKKYSIIKLCVSKLKTPIFFFPFVILRKNPWSSIKIPITEIKLNPKIKFFIHANQLTTNQFLSIYSGVITQLYILFSFNICYRVCEKISFIKFRSSISLLFQIKDKNIMISQFVYVFVDCRLEIYDLENTQKPILREIS